MSIIQTKITIVLACVMLITACSTTTIKTVPNVTDLKPENLTNSTVVVESIPKLLDNQVLIGLSGRLVVMRLSQDSMIAYGSGSKDDWAKEVVRFGKVDLSNITTLILPTNLESYDGAAHYYYLKWSPTIYYTGLKSLSYSYDALNMMNANRTVVSTPIQIPTPYGDMQLEPSYVTGFHDHPNDNVLTLSFTTPTGHRLLLLGSCGQECFDQVRPGNADVLVLTPESCEAIMNLQVVGEVRPNTLILPENCSNNADYKLLVPKVVIVNDADWITEVI